MKNNNYLKYIVLAVLIMCCMNVVTQIIKNVDKEKRLKSEISIYKEKIEIIKNKMKLSDDVDLEYEKEKIARNKIKMVKNDEQVYKYLKNNQEEK